MNDLPKQKWGLSAISMDRLRATARLILAKRPQSPDMAVYFVHAFLVDGKHVRDEDGRPVQCPLCEVRRARLFNEDGVQPKRLGAPPTLTVWFDSAIENCPNYTPVAIGEQRGTPGEIVQ
jgi:hypothetical protein